MPPRDQPTSSPSYPTTLNEAGRAFQKRVQNPRMFRAYMLAKQTTLGVTGAYLEIIELHHVRLILPTSKRPTRDLFDRPATAAILGAAEMCSAALLMLQLRNQRALYRPLLTSLRLETLHPDEHRAHPPSRMSFEVEDALAHAQLVARANQERPDEVASDLIVLARDQNQELTHRVTLTWTLYPPQD